MHASISAARQTRCMLWLVTAMEPPLLLIASRSASLLNLWSDVSSRASCSHRE